MCAEALAGVISDFQKVGDGLLVCFGSLVSMSVVTKEGSNVGKESGGVLCSLIFELIDICRKGE